MKTNNALWLIILFFGRMCDLAAMQDAEQLKVPPTLALPRHVDSLSGDFDREDIVPEPTESLFRVLGREAMHPGSLSDIADSIKYLVVEHQAAVDAEDVTGKRPLHIAAWAGLDAAVNALLDVGADVNARTSSDDVDALWIAMKHGHWSTAALLVRRGAFVTKSHIRVAKRWLKNGRDSFVDVLKAAHRAQCS